jgi:hypothetical protein
MANTYSLIEAKTLGTAVASVTFTSIPQTFTDLQLLISSRATQNVTRELIKIYPNGSTANNTRFLSFGYDSGSVASGTSTESIIGWQSGNSTTANTFANGSVYFPNYTSSDYKSYSADVVAENNSSSSWIVSLNTSLWSNTAAITSIEIACETSTFAVNSTFYLYGINKS